MLVRYLDWDIRGVKFRSFAVYAFSSVLVLGIISFVFNVLEALDLVSDKTKIDYWDTAPLASMTIGAVSGVVYMYRQMKAENERLRDTCDHLSQTHSFYN